jgi:hypothetical protein
LKNLPTITLTEMERLLDAAHDDADAAYALAPFLNMDFWGGEDDETPINTEVDEAIESRLDACLPSIQSMTGFLGVVTLIVWGYRRSKLGRGEPDSGMVLERIYEDLDDEYNGSGETTDPSPAVADAARALCDLIRRTYVPWNCEPVVTVTLDVADVRRKLAEFWPDEFAK